MLQPVRGPDRGGPHLLVPGPGQRAGPVRVRAHVRRHLQPDPRHLPRHLHAHHQPHHLRRHGHHSPRQVPHVKRSVNEILVSPLKYFCILAAQEEKKCQNEEVNELLTEKPKCQSEESNHVIEKCTC